MKPLSPSSSFRWPLSDSSSLFALGGGWGGGGEGGGFSVATGVQSNPLRLKMSFSLGILDKFGVPYVYLFFPHPLLFTLYFLLARPLYYLWMCVKLLCYWQTV